MTHDMDNWQTLIKEREFNDLLIEWNKKINLVSRRKTDVSDLIEDSKLFFEYINFFDGVKILDLGTGGGFPGIIIAIHHPEASLTLIDSIQKKYNVVTDIVKKLGLKNSETICTRAEELHNNPLYKQQFNYVVARSVAVLQDLCNWSKDLLKPGGKLITIKGGEITGEVNKTKKLGYVKNIAIKTLEERKAIIVTF
jgi:16S rRNA (guanine527-N7)-methyltransferase